MCPITASGRSTATMLILPSDTACNNMFGSEKLVSILIPSIDCNADR